MLHRDIIDPIKAHTFDSIHAIMEQLSVGEIEKTNQMNKVVNSALDGNVVIYLDGDLFVLLVKIPSRVGRPLSLALNESQVVGAQVAFTESIILNLALNQKLY